MGGVETVSRVVLGDRCWDLADGLPHVGIEARLGDSVEDLGRPSLRASSTVATGETRERAAKRLP
jgi:hypothetical protein